MKAKKQWLRPKNLHRLHLIDASLRRNEWRYWRRQGLAVLALVFGTLLTLPGIPGPGTIFVLLGIILADFPRKHKLVHWLSQKMWFRHTRVYLRKRWHFLVMLGEPWTDEVLHPEKAESGENSPANAVEPL